MSLVVSIVIAMFFFFGGCMQLGAYIARTAVQDVPAYVTGMMLSSWPLAVAAVLFMLIEMRLHGTQVSEAEYEGRDVTERPTPQRAAQPAEDGSYFRINGVGVQVSEHPASQPARVVQGPQPNSRAHTPFATPPPFEQGNAGICTDKPVGETPPPAPKKEEETADLSYFKL